jgi:hypothetical protein
MVFSGCLDCLQQFSASRCAKGVSAERRDEIVSQRSTPSSGVAASCAAYARQLVPAAPRASYSACAQEEAAVGARSATARRYAPRTTRRWSPRAALRPCRGGCGSGRRGGGGADGRGRGERGRGKQAADVHAGTEDEVTEGPGKAEAAGEVRAPPSPSPSMSTSSRAKSRILALPSPPLLHPLLSSSLLRLAGSMPRLCGSRRRLPPWISSPTQGSAVATSSSAGGPRRGGRRRSAGSEPGVRRRWPREWSATL